MPKGKKQSKKNNKKNKQNKKSKREEEDYEKKIQKLESVVSQRRNQVICDVFVSCRMMEKKGSGFDKIIDDYKNLSDDLYPLCATTRSTFTIILKNKKYKLNKINNNNL